MAKALSLFYPHVEPHVYGCPAPMMDQALVYAAALFCRETLIVNDISTLDVVIDQPDYDLDLPAATRLSKVLDVFVGERRLEPVGTDYVRRATALRGTVDGDEPEVGPPRAFFQKLVSDPTISLYPVPDESIATGLTVRAAFEPATAAQTLPDILYDYHLPDIAHGAVAHLLTLPGQAFTNPMAAREFAARFTSAMMKARPVASYGRVRFTGRVAPRPFA